MARKRSAADGAPDVLQIVAQMRQSPSKGRGQRSPLYLWLRDNHARLAAEFSSSAPSWPRLAAALGSSGILNGEGKVPTAEGTRTVWYRVRQELSGTRKRAGVEGHMGVRPIKPPAQPGAANSPPSPSDGADQPRRFGPVRVRGSQAVEAGPAVSLTAPAPANEPTVDVDDVLSKFMPSAGKRG